MIAMRGAFAVVAAILVLGTTPSAANASSPDETPGEDRPEEVTSGGVEHTIRQALEAALGVGAFPITMEVDERTVTLRGWVGTREEKRAAQRVVLAVPAVRHVVNVLTVDPGGHRHDARIRARIEEALLDSPDVRGYEVDVHVRNGIASLRGQAGSPAERTRAGELARRTPGVHRVVNGLVAPTTWTWEHDWQVRYDIEQALGERHPGIREQVSVTVRDGVGTLEGRVDDRRERDAVGELARRGGAAKVDNRLAVPPAHGTPQAG